MQLGIDLAEGAVGSSWTRAPNAQTAWVFAVAMPYPLPIHLRAPAETMACQLVRSVVSQGFADVRC